MFFGQFCSTKPLTSYSKWVDSITHICGNGYRKIRRMSSLRARQGERGHMTKAEFIDQVVKTSEEMDLTKKAAGELIDSIFNIVGRAIKKDGRFSYPGFGTFTMKKRAARKGRNPRTGTEIRIKASKTVGFKPAPSLKKTL